MATKIKDADHCHIRREDADPDGDDYSNAENQRHEERNHGQPPYLKFNQKKFYKKCFYKVQ